MLSSVRALTFAIGRVQIGSAGLATAGTSSTSPKRLPRGYNRPTAYGVFIKDNFKGNDVKAEAKRIASLWKSLPVTDKEPYILKAKKIGEQRQAEFQKLPAAEQKGAVEKSAADLSKEKRFRRLRALRNFRLKTGHPTRPLTAFTLFCKERYNENKGPDFVQTARSLAEQWKTLPQAERAPYEEKAKKNLESYNISVKAWKKTHGAVYEGIKAEVRAKKVRVVAKKGRPSRYNKTVYNRVANRLKRAGKITTKTQKRVKAAAK